MQGRRKFCKIRYFPNILLTLSSSIKAKLIRVNAVVHFFLSIAKVSLQSWFFTFAYVLQCTLYICINTRNKLIAKVCSVEGQLSQSQVWGNCLFLFHCNLIIDSFGIRSILFLTTIISSFREQLAFFASMGVFFYIPSFLSYSVYNHLFFLFPLFLSHSLCCFPQQIVDYFLSWSIINDRVRTFEEIWTPA